MHMHFFAIFHTCIAIGRRDDPFFPGRGVLHTADYLGFDGWNPGLKFATFSIFYFTLTFLWPNYVRLWRLAIQVWGWQVDSIHPCFAIWIPLCMWATDLHVNVSTFVTGIEGVDVHQVDTTGSWACCFGKDINSTRYVINSFLSGFQIIKQIPKSNNEFFMAKTKILSQV